MSAGCMNLPATVFLCDFLKVRHAVTGRLEQKGGMKLIPLLKIREFQKVFFIQNKISIGRSFYLLSTD